METSQKAWKHDFDEMCVRNVKIHKMLWHKWSKIPALISTLKVSHPDAVNYPIFATQNQGTFANIVISVCIPLWSGI